MEVNIGRAFYVLLYEEGFEAEDVLEALPQILSKIKQIVNHFDGVLR